MTRASTTEIAAREVRTIDPPENWIQRLSRESPLWAHPTLEKALALLGHRARQTTIGKYMVRAPKTPGDTWRNFVARHMDVTAACALFVVSALTCKQLYCFVVLSHDHRRIVHVNVTEHPSAEWTCQQIIEAFTTGPCPVSWCATATASAAMSSGGRSRYSASRRWSPDPRCRCRNLRRACHRIDPSRVHRPHHRDG